MIHTVKGYSQWSRSRCFSGILLLFLWSNRYWLFDLWFLCLFWIYLYIWKFSVHILLKPSLKDFEHYFTIMWNECNFVAVWILFGISLLWPQIMSSLLQNSDLKKVGETTVLFSSVQSRPTLCDPMNHSVPGLPVHHQLPESTQTHVHWVGDAIQPSHPLSSPSPLAFSLSQHQGLFKWVSSSHQVAKILESQFQHQSFQWTPRTDLL